METPIFHKITEKNGKILHTTSYFREKPIGLSQFCNFEQKQMRQRWSSDTIRRLFIVSLT